MNKKSIVFIIILLSSSAFLGALKNKSDVVSLETQLHKNETTEIAKLEFEVHALKAELDKLDAPRAINNSATPPLFRKEIIEKMNLYAAQLGKLAKLQIAEMEKDKNL